MSVGIVIECDPRDSDHPCLENMAIGIKGILNENLKTLQLERESASLWKHKDPVAMLVPSKKKIFFCCESDFNR